MSEKKKAAFIEAVYSYYKKHGRHDLPWRLTTDPYKIAVSEVMLQQTQVARVVEKYNLFLKTFPTTKALAHAPLQEVLRLWSGLGYNRRAKFLWQMAQTIEKEYSGAFPKTYETLLALPGIGPYTATAIYAFAYNKAAVCIETNIRSVYLHHFFSDGSKSSDMKVNDKDLLPLIEMTLDQKNPRTWYWALMDYGSHLKQSGVRIHRASASYKKQSAFKGSLREVRGAIVKLLTEHPVTFLQLEQTLGFETSRIEDALNALLEERMVVKKGRYYSVS